MKRAIFVNFKVQEKFPIVTLPKLNTSRYVFVAVFGQSRYMLHFSKRSLQRYKLTLVLCLGVTLKKRPLYFFTIDATKLRDKLRSVTADYLTVEPRFNEPLFNEVLDITNYALRPGQNYSKMYGIEPRSV